MSRLARVLLAAAVLAHLLLGRSHDPAPTRPEVPPEVLARAAPRIAGGATVLLLNAGDQWEAFQASHLLYPRTVLWGVPAPKVSRFDWHVPVSLEPAAFRELLAREHVRYVLVDGLDLARLPAVPRATVASLGEDQLLLELPP